MTAVAQTAPTIRFAEGDFRVGHSINRAVFMLSRNSTMFVALALGVTVPTFLLQRLEKTYPALSLLILLIAAVGSLVQAVIAYGTFENMRGRSPGLRALLQISMRRSVPVLGVSIVLWVGLVLGLLALIVPAFMAMTAWFVALPACVVERAGPIASLKRSAQLTKGHRWKILSVVLLMGITQAVAVIPGLVHTTLGSLVIPIWNAGALALDSVLMAVIYHDLRVAKEGSDTGRIASVFE